MNEIVAVQVGKLANKKRIETVEGEVVINRVPTIYDVAFEAGVSIATVSRVINNIAVVSPKTRMKVEIAIRKLNFNPNENAVETAKLRAE